MKESEIKKNVYVVINSSDATTNTHSSSRVMRSMVGETHKIKYTIKTRHGKAAIINGYYWHPKDLSLLIKPKIEKPKTQYFNPKELVL